MNIFGVRNSIRNISLNFDWMSTNARLISASSPYPPGNRPCPLGRVPLGLSVSLVSSPSSFVLKIRRPERGQALMDRIGGNTRASSDGERVIFSTEDEGEDTGDTETRCSLPGNAPSRRGGGARLAGMRGGRIVLG